MLQRPAVLRAPVPAAAAALGIVAVVLVAYANALHGELVFDDWSSIRDNALLGNVAAWLPGGAGYAERPTRFVAYLTFALNHAVGGLDVVGYHAANVAIHAANALLVYALVCVAFRTPRLAPSALAGSARDVALAAALLFAAHPLQSQAVAYIVQRIASLATLFYLAAAVLYARWRVASPAPAWRRAGWYLAALAAAALAVKTKEIAFTLPFALAAFEALFLEGAPWRRAAWLLPFLAIALLVPLSLLELRQPIGEVLASAQDATKIDTTMSRWDYLVTEVAVVATYLRLLVLPVGQNIDHDFPLYSSVLAPRVLASAAVLGGLLAGAVVLVRRTSPRARQPVDPAARLVAFGIVWFFLGLSVESSVIPIVDVIFEHRVYLPGAGFFVAVVAGGALVLRRLTASPARLTLGIAAALSVVLAAATLQRNRVWATSLALWTDAVEKSPNKTRPHSNVALALSAAGRDAEALPQFEAVVRINPLHVSGMNNLAVCLVRLGRVPEAERWLEEALRLKPDHAETWFNLGSLRMDQHRDAEAVELLSRAVTLDPGYVQAYANLSSALLQLGRPAEAVRLVEGKDALLARSPEARFNLGVAYVLLGDAGGAQRALAALARLSPERAAELASFMRAQARR